MVEVRGTSRVVNEGGSWNMLRLNESVVMLSRLWYYDDKLRLAVLACRLYSFCLSPQRTP